MSENEVVIARASRLEDLRTIALGTWGFLLQLLYSLRLTARLRALHDDKDDC